MIMDKEQIIYRNDFVKEIWENSQRFCKEEGVDAPQYVEVNKIFEIVEKYKDKEIERLNNIIDEIRKIVKYEKEELDKFKGVDLLINTYQQVFGVMLEMLELKEGK